MSSFKVGELEGALLDCAVAMAEGHLVKARGLDLWVETQDQSEEGGLIGYLSRVYTPMYSPSTLWGQGGPIIEREAICWEVSSEWRDDGNYGQSWEATLGDGKYYSGDTPLIAAMRAYVHSKLGPEVDFPESSRSGT
jgi:hypothetical protein